MTNRVRIVTYAWGDEYISDLLNMTIPALLAPGNLPSLLESFECEFVLLSQQAKFRSIEAHPAFRRVAELCPARLVSLDDLVVGHWYGISLTFALHRGIADLGPAMVDTFCVFLNADFVLADGSLQTMVAKMKAGERLIVAPSYCVVAEQVAPLLRVRRDDARMELSLSRREMAAIALRHRHYTIRAKTLNQRVFRTHRYDQFYWYVDDQTLLGRQLPIAVVCMRPERHLEEMRAFWDYGLISDACPNTIPCVLGDSDDFLMIELRGEQTYTEFLSLGWPTIQEIADDLSSFTTKDHRDYGRYPLVLHAADLPADLVEERQKFDAFMDDLYARLRPPVSYVGHRFWADAIDHFKRMRADYLRLHARSDEINDLDKGTSDNDVGDEDADDENDGNEDQQLQRPSSAPRDWRPQIAPGRLPAMALDAAHQVYLRVIGSMPNLTRNHPFWTDLDLVLQLLHQAQARPKARILVIQSQNNLFKEVVKAKRVRGERVREALIRFSSSCNPVDVVRVSGKFHEVGDYGGVRFWGEHVSDGAPRNASLILTSNSDIAIHLPSSSGPDITVVASSVVITVGRAGTGDGTAADAGSARDVEDDLRDSTDNGGVRKKRVEYDLCLCDLSEQDLHHFKQLYSSIRPRMRTGAKVVGLFFNRDYKMFNPQDLTLIRNAFPLSDESRLHFQGSKRTRRARQLFTRGIDLSKKRSISERLAAPLWLLASFVVAAVVNRQSRRSDSGVFAADASSIVLELTVKRPVPAERAGGAAALGALVGHD